MKSVIAVEGLVKRYRRGGWRRNSVTALDDVSFTVEPGEAFGFIGPNGAGKSTTIKLLLGAMRADAGTILLQGLPIEDPDSRRCLGYVQENPALYDHLTPLEMLLMAMRIHGVEADDPVGHALGWLDRLSLSGSARRAVREFSKGMVQRTAIAVAMAIRPKLLILDEPLSGLDPIGRRDVVDLLAAYKGGGGSLFFTSHVLHDVERLADRFGLIHNGRLRSVRTPAELADNEEGIVVRSQGANPIAGMIEESRGRWTSTVSRSELWSRLDALRCAGHLLIEVRPALNLEAAFMRAVGES